MRSPVKSLFAAALLVSVAGGAYAGARPPGGPAGVGVDTRNMSDDQLRRRMLDACVGLMTQKPEPLKSAAATRCSCYSSSVMKALSQDERDALRGTGGFSASARPKAERALRACRVAG